MESKANILGTDLPDTPFQKALQVLAETSPEQAQLIERAILEGRLSIQDVLCNDKIKMQHLV